MLGLLAAERLPDQVFAADVRMAKVDCEANRQLCMEHMIRAYPTIQTYTHGDNTPVRHPALKLKIPA